jgi:hypothetical protein
MSTEIQEKKEKKVKLDIEGEVVGDESVKKEKKDKKRKEREEEEEVKPAEVSSSGEIIGETKEQRKARKKAKKEVCFPLFFRGYGTDEIGKES